MLYYLKVEVLGEAATQSQEGIPARYEGGSIVIFNQNFTGLFVC